MDQPLSSSETRAQYTASLTSRLRIACAGKPVTEWARLTGTHSETVRRYLSSVPPPVEFLGAVAAHLNLSADWLLTGRGPMHQSDVVRAAIAELSHDQLRSLVAHSTADEPPRVLKFFPLHDQPAQKEMAGGGPH